jgi:hypothetical protein
MSDHYRRQVQQLEAQLARKSKEVSPAGPLRWTRCWCS